ncbi:unnamed protein product [Angiostrongylus costaricensis]|uniref:Helitron_like_N domain-containing protein n=1 Tax=Angiostrongylus costaricensis TaxID=334426 RepID=A0A0R3PFI9_ANGCS|nr:unnamed protein product [Angiostrongylus costaricensis]
MAIQPTIGPEGRMGSEETCEHFSEHADSSRSREFEGNPTFPQYVVTDDNELIQLLLDVAGESAHQFQNLQNIGQQLDHTGEVHRLADAVVDLETIGNFVESLGVGANEVVIDSCPQEHVLSNPYHASQEARLRQIEIVPRSASQPKRPLHGRLDDDSLAHQNYNEDEWDGVHLEDFTRGPDERTAVLSAEDQQELSNLRPLKTIQRPYFPPNLSPIEKKEYLLVNYKRACDRYLPFANVAVLEADTKYNPVEPVGSDLYRFHSRGAHIHGFFRFVIDTRDRPNLDQTRYIQDIIFGKVFPLFPDYDEWDNRMRREFQQLSNRLLQMFESKRRSTTNENRGGRAPIIRCVPKPTEKPPPDYVKQQGIQSEGIPRSCEPLLSSFAPQLTSTTTLPDLYTTRLKQVTGDGSASELVAVPHENLSGSRTQACEASKRDNASQLVDSVLANRGRATLQWEEPLPQRASIPQSFACSKRVGHLKYAIFIRSRPTLVFYFLESELNDLFFCFTSAFNHQRLSAKPVESETIHMTVTETTEPAIDATGHYVVSPGELSRLHRAATVEQRCIPRATVRSLREMADSARKGGGSYYWTSGSRQEAAWVSTIGQAPRCTRNSMRPTSSTAMQNLPFHSGVIRTQLSTNTHATEVLRWPAVLTRNTASTTASSLSPSEHDHHRSHSSGHCETPSSNYRRSASTGRPATRTLVTNLVSGLGEKVCASSGQILADFPIDGNYTTASTEIADKNQSIVNECSPSLISKGQSQLPDQNNSRRNVQGMLSRIRASKETRPLKPTGYFRDEHGRLRRVKRLPDGTLSTGDRTLCSLVCQLGRIPTEKRSGAEVHRSRSEAANTVWDVQSIAGKRGKKTGRKLDQCSQSQAFLASYSHSTSFSKCKSILQRQKSWNFDTKTQPRTESRKKNMPYPDDDNIIIKISKTHKRSMKRVLLDHDSTAAARKSVQVLLSGPHESDLNEDDAVDISVEAEYLNHASDVSIGLANTKFSCHYVEERCFVVQKTFIEFKYSKHCSSHSLYTAHMKLSGNDEHLQVSFLWPCTNVELAQMSVVESNFSLFHLVTDSVMGMDQESEGINICTIEAITVPSEEYYPLSNISTSSVIENALETEHIFVSHNVSCSTQERIALSAVQVHCAFDNGKDAEEVTITSVERNIRVEAFSTIKSIHLDYEGLQKAQVFPSQKRSWKDGDEQVGCRSNYEQNPPLSSKSQSGMRSTWGKDGKSRTSLGEIVHRPPMTSTSIDSSDYEKISTGTNRSETYRSLDVRREHILEYEAEPNFTETTCSNQHSINTADSNFTANDELHHVSSAMPSTNEEMEDLYVSMLNSPSWDLIMDYAENTDLEQFMGMELYIGDSSFRDTGFFDSIGEGERNSISGAPSIAATAYHGDPASGGLFDLTSSEFFLNGVEERSSNLQRNLAETTCSNQHSVNSADTNFTANDALRHASSAGPSTNEEMEDLHIIKFNSPSWDLIMDYAENADLEQFMGMEPYIEDSSFRDTGFFDSIGEGERNSVSGAASIAATADDGDPASGGLFDLTSSEFFLNGVEERSSNLQRNLAETTCSNQHSVNSADTNFTANDALRHASSAGLSTNEEMEDLHIMFNSPSWDLIMDYAENTDLEQFVGMEQELERPSISSNEAMTYPFVECCSFTHPSPDHLQTQQVFHSQRRIWEDGNKQFSFFQKKKNPWNTFMEQLKYLQPGIFAEKDVDPKLFSPIAPVWTTANREQEDLCIPSFLTIEGTRAEKDLNTRCFVGGVDSFESSSSTARFSGMERRISKRRRSQLHGVRFVLCYVSPIQIHHY